jgi:hypothetical protein
VSRALGLLALVGVLAACGSSSAASSSGSTAAGCGPAGADTVADGAKARVYSRGGSLYGCTTDGQHQYRLGSGKLCLGRQQAGPVAVAGTLAAYALRRCGIDTSSAQVIVQRLSDGKRLSSHDAITGPVGPESFQSVGSIVVTGGGQVAWIGSMSSIVMHRQTTQVLATDGSGHVRRLDSGSGVAAKSLHLHGGKLSWIHGGNRRSASLP